MSGVYVLRVLACIHNDRSKSSGKTGFHSFADCPQRLHKLYGFQCGGFTEDQLMAQFWKPGQVTKILQDEKFIFYGM